MPNSHNKNNDGSLKMNYIYLILKIKNYFQFNAKQCFFKKNTAWLESEQAAVPHGYHRQAQALVSRDSLDKSKAFMNLKAHVCPNREVLTTGNTAQWAVHKSTCNLYLSRFFLACFCLQELTKILNLSVMTTAM